MILLIALLLSFTSLPFRAYHALSAPNQVLETSPEAILIFGGAGMPSADGLQRTHFAAALASEYLSVPVIIAHTENKNDSNRLWQLKLMAHELVLKGVDTNRIIFEPKGTNTVTQCKLVFAQTSDIPIVAVTSPEHMLRAILTLKKAGFTQVGGVATFEQPINEESLKKSADPNLIVHESLAIRYNMWNYLIYEIKVVRELVALSYYWLMGWI